MLAQLSIRTIRSPFPSASHPETRANTLLSTPRVFNNLQHPFPATPLLLHSCEKHPGVGGKTAKFLTQRAQRSERASRLRARKGHGDNGIGPKSVRHPSR